VAVSAERRRHIPPLGDPARIGCALRGGSVAGTLRVGSHDFDRSLRGAENASEHPASGLEANLAAIAEAVRRSGASIALLTYPSSASVYGRASGRIRRVALAAGIPLVDLTREFESLCPAEPCPSWFFADHHPTAAGMERVAVAVEGRLGELGF
jgi:hypothetical protein